MKIYTKTGDEAQPDCSAAAAFRRIDPRVEAYGDVDELNAVLGIARAVEIDAADR